MSGKLRKIFSDGKKKLVGFASAGCPTIGESLEFMDAMLAGGVDVLEIGVPFSDPMADGPTIQASSQKALASGTTLKDVLSLCEKLSKKHPEKGFVLFSYYNLIFHMGPEKFAKTAKEAGADGVLVVDVPLEERKEIKPILDKFGLDLIPLVSPATPKARMKEILKGIGGFVYYIIHKGVTGTRTELPKDLKEKVRELKKISTLPVAAGFGVKDPEMAKRVAKTADGVVMGSAFVRIQLDGDLSSAKKAAKAKKLAADCRSALDQ